MKKFIKNILRKRIVVAIIIVVLIFGVYQIFFKKEKADFTLAEVMRANVVQEVSETGKVKQGDVISLTFKNSGQIKEINVEVGDKVQAGQVLAKLDTSQLQIQLAQAQAALSIANAQKNDALISMETDYSDALSTLNDVRLKADNVLIFIDYLKREYFGKGDADSIDVADNRDRIYRALNDVKFYINKAQNSETQEDIDTALSVAEEDLWTIKIALESVRSVIDAGNYKDIVSTTDKTSLDTQRSYINTAHSSVVSDQSTIALDKAQVSAQLQEDGKGLYQSQVDEADANVRLLQNQIQDSYLKSPVAGQIGKINKKIGEMVLSASQDAVMTFLPDSPFQIEVDIYEEEVVKINIGNPVDVSLVAVPEKILNGRVILIDSAEELIDGVVYYKVKIAFEGDVPENLKSGMTADITIKTAIKENVLTIPEAAIRQINGKNTVQVMVNKKAEEREVEIGLKGNEGIVEIISGLNEGEEVIVK